MKPPKRGLGGAQGGGAGGGRNLLIRGKGALCFGSRASG